MNEYIIAAKLSAALAVLAFIFAISTRLLLAKYRRPAFLTNDSKVGKSVPQKMVLEGQTANQAAPQFVQYTRPTFKKNNLEEEMISRSFRINGKDPFENDSSTYGLDESGITLSITAINRI
jgi:hypothetical protein